LFLAYFYLVPNPNRNKLKTKKFHTVGLVPNPIRNKLKTKKYHTVGELGTRPTVWYFFVFSLFLLRLGTRPTVWYFFVFSLFLMGLRNTTLLA
jgi:hypothetical protein